LPDSYIVVPSQTPYSLQFPQMGTTELPAQKYWRCCALVEVARWGSKSKSKVIPVGRQKRATA